MAETSAPAGVCPAIETRHAAGTARVGRTQVACDARAPEAAVRAFADAGATELQLAPAGPPADRARTIAFKASLEG